MKKQIDMVIVIVFIAFLLMISAVALGDLISDSHSYQRLILGVAPKAID